MIENDWASDTSRNSSQKCPELLRVASLNKAVKLVSATTTSESQNLRGLRLGRQVCDTEMMAIPGSKFTKNRRFIEWIWINNNKYIGVDITQGINGIPDINMIKYEWIGHLFGTSGTSWDLPTCIQPLGSMILPSREVFNMAMATGIAVNKGYAPCLVSSTCIILYHCIHYCIHLFSLDIQIGSLFPKSVDMHRSLFTLHSGPVLSFSR